MGNTLATIFGNGSVNVSLLRFLVAVCIVVHLEEWSDSCKAPRNDNMRS